MLPVLGKKTVEFIMMDVGANAEYKPKMFAIRYCLVATIQTTFLATKINSRFVK